jgi:hypothetical protein
MSHRRAPFLLLPALVLFVSVAACGTQTEQAPADIALDPDVAEALVDTQADLDDVAIPGHAALFVGNSYVHVNDVPALYRRGLTPSFSEVRTEQVTPGGYTLARHANDAMTDGTDLARWLRTGTPAETDFDVVILQEQSQIGGFPLVGPGFASARAATVAAATELSTLATARGAAVVLYLTWGRLNGDESNPTIGYDTYLGMQDRLDEGYITLAAHLREQGATVHLAPVGGGFRLVYEQVIKNGGDPLANGSDFVALYDPDGSHPSLRGAYLAACVLATVATQKDPTYFTDEPTLGPAVSQSLRDTCAAAVTDPRWNVPTVHRPAATFGPDSVAYTAFGSAVVIGGSSLIVGSPALPPETTTASARLYEATDDGYAETVRWPDGDPLPTALERGFAKYVAASADGKTVLMSPGPHLYRKADSWQRSLLRPDLEEQVATSIALSADGKRALVSEPGGPDVGSEVAIARVLVDDGAQWIEDGVLYGRSAGWFSADVALDAEGARALIGESPGLIFVRGTDGWSLEATLPTERGAVAISGDGSHAIVGDNELGQVSLFARTGSSWTLRTQLKGVASRTFGTSVAVTADGTRVAIGTPFEASISTDGLTGVVRIFDLQDGTVELAHLLVPPTRTDRVVDMPQFGTSIDMSPDGRRIAVGAPRYEPLGGGLNLGRVYLFTLP